MIMSRYFYELLEYIDSLTIIDTHEHLPCDESHLSETGCAESGHDVFCEYLNGYFNRDLISSGMPKKDYLKLFEVTRPIKERWEIVEPYWNVCRHTGYGRCLDIAARDIYGFERIDANTIEPLNDAFMQACKIGRYERVLKEKCKIEISLLDYDLDCDKRYFLSVFQLGSYFSPKSWNDIEATKESFNIPINCLDDWLDACLMEIDAAIKKGAIGFKNPMAYERTLLIERATYNDAERAFFEVLKTIRTPEWLTGGIQAPKEFQDYMLHFIFRELGKRGLPVQIHTGLLEGNGNWLADSNPTLLTPLFLEYPHIDFDLFHIGYPYQNEVTALSKMFPNVYIDMCWAHIISPFAGVNALSDFLDAVPYNKICAFGGDFLFVDGVYGHLKIAQQNVSQVLASKVENGNFSVEEAKVIAKAMFYDNPKRIFKLYYKRSQDAVTV